MPDPSTYRPAVGSIPESPGVYRFRDPNGRVISAGRARSLRQRLTSYFADVAGLPPRTRQMVTTAASVDWTVVGTEVEALQLEYNWIKEFDPRFNVRYRDDKSYPWLAVTLDESFPRAQVMRGAKRRGMKYFGPYAHAWAIRETLDALLRVFPMRPCRIGALNRAMEKQAVVLGDGTDADVVAFAQDELEAAVQVFYVRGGRVKGQRGWVVDKIEEIDIPGLVEQFLAQVYLDEQSEVPREVLVPALPEDDDVVTELLEILRGGKVSLRVPQRGDKRALLETVERNAKEAFVRHKLKRSSDITSRSLALQELQDSLGLLEAPLRIECYDVSNLQGSEVVASMVVFEDGLARKSEYRRFAIRGVEGQDDVRSINEVIYRRFRRYLEERIETGELDSDLDADERPQPVDPVTGKPKKFAYPPQLVVVDGGPPPGAAAAAAMRKRGVPHRPLSRVA